MLLIQQAESNLKEYLYYINYHCHFTASGSLLTAMFRRKFFLNVCNTGSSFTWKYSIGGV